MQENNTDNLFGIKPQFAVQLGFSLLCLILLIDILSPDDYRFVLLYLFPAAIVALNAKSMKVVIVAFIISTLFENYFLFRDNYFLHYFTKIDLVNILIRCLATLLIIWLARSLRQSQLLVNRMANTDSLTGLWNRRWARIVIEQAIAKLEEFREVFSVALIDVDNFKKINDSRGHMVGDQVLTKIAHTLMEFSSENAIFFRLGGDEFLIVAPRVDDLKMNVICSDIVKKVNQTMSDSGYPVTISIGMATYRDTSNTVSEILHQVDLEMYSYKAAGKILNKNPSIKAINI